MNLSMQQGNLLGCALYCATEGDYVEYTLSPLAPGDYDVYFWNIHFESVEFHSSTVPPKMYAQIFAGGKLYDHISLPSNTESKNRHGRYDLLGTYTFDGSGNEYLRFYSIGVYHARAADIKLVSKANPAKELVIAPIDARFSIHGDWEYSFMLADDESTVVHIQPAVLLPHSEIHFEPHVFYEIVLVEKGTVLCTAGGETKRLEKGGILIMDVWLPHTYYNDSDQPCTLSCIFAYGDIYGDFARLRRQKAKREKRPPLTLLYPGDALFSSILSRVLFITDELSKLSRAQKLLFTKLVIFEILGYAGAHTGEENQNAPDWLKNAREKMLHATDLSDGINEMVRLSGKTQEHFTRSMKKFYGETPTSFINTLRVKRGADLLLQSDLNILDIAFACGFQSQSHFYEEFRKIHRLSPAKYRKIHRTGS